MSRIALKIGLRELSGGFKGFWIYLACLILGTAAIAAAGSVTEVFTRGLAGEARILLGGDAMFSMSQRRPDAQERAFMTDLGRITETAAGLIALHRPDAALIVLPERDRHPRIVEAATSLACPTEVIAVSGEWSD